MKFPSNTPFLDLVIVKIGIFRYILIHVQGASYNFHFSQIWEQLMFKK